MTDRNMLNFMTQTDGREIMSYTAKELAALPTLSQEDAKYWLRKRLAKRGGGKPGEFDFATYELKMLPTISNGHYGDLKIETEDRRVWLSRSGLDDDALYENTVTIEAKLPDGFWIVVVRYDGDL